MSTREKPAIDSPLGIIAIFLISVLVSHSLLQIWLKDENNNTTLADSLLSIYNSLCEYKIATPGHTCNHSFTPDVLIKNSLNDLNTAISLLPNLASSQKILGPFQGSEAEAARYLSLLLSIEKSRRHQHRENYSAIPNTIKSIYNIWTSYPLLVARSACTFCYNHSNKMEKLINSSSLDNATLEKLAHDPTFFSYMKNSQNITDEQKMRFADMHASLSSAGSSKTAEVIGEILINQERWDILNLWVSKGLNGSRSISKHDLSKIPFNIVVSAWEHGVSIGYDQAALTQFLIKSGHRPALRWLIWLLGTDYQYLKGYNFDRQEGIYTSILRQYTNFHQYKGNDLAHFYNRNWQSIHWHKNKWRAF